MNLGDMSGANDETRESSASPQVSLEVSQYRTLGGRMDELL